MSKASRRVHPVVGGTVSNVSCDHGWSTGRWCQVHHGNERRTAPAAAGCVIEATGWTEYMVVIRYLSDFVLQR